MYVQTSTIFAAFFELTLLLQITVYRSLRLPKALYLAAKIKGTVSFLLKSKFFLFDYLANLIFNIFCMSATFSHFGFG